MDQGQVRPIEEGKVFPYPVPSHEGTVMVVWDLGLVALMQKFRLTPAEIGAFKAGFRRFSYLEKEGPVPLALWVFDFPDPLGKIDAVFNARSSKPEWIASYLNTQVGGVMNALYLFLVEGKIYRGGKLVGLDPEAVMRFHETICKQMAAQYTQEEFNLAARDLFKLSPTELFEQGTVFSFDED